MRAHWLMLLACSMLARVAIAQQYAQPCDQIDADRERLSQALYRLADGLEHDLVQDDVQVAETLYGIEREALHLFEESMRVEFPSPTAQEGTQDNLRALVGRILNLEERVQKHAIETLDQALPGEPERQLWAREGNDLYRPLYRLGTPLPGQAEKTPREALADMQRKFAEKGGNDGDFHFLNRRGLAVLPSGVLAEWVQFGASRVRFTIAGAKHPVIAEGKSTRGAGSLKIWKDADGQVLLAIVSNSSGNYKPGTGSTEGPVQQLAALGVEESRILVTSIIPSEPEIVKLLMKAKLKFSDEQIKQHVFAVREATGRAPRWELAPRGRANRYKAGTP